MKKNSIIITACVLGLAAVCLLPTKTQSASSGFNTGLAMRSVIVPTYEEMQDALSKANALSVFLVNSGNTNSDGLGGVFVWDCDSTNDIDNLNVFPTYSGQGRLVRIDSRVPQVRSAGLEKEYTIASGLITPLGEDYFLIDTEGDAASDALVNIIPTHYSSGDIITIQPAHTDRTVVVTDASTGIQAAGDFTMNSTLDIARFMLKGTNWVELTRSDNGT